MSDPLGLIGSLNRPLVPSSGGGGQTPVDPSQPSFKNVLMENIQQVDKLQKEANLAIEDLQTGRRTDLEGVLAATQKADTAFRMLVALRNKLQTAFEEVKQMRT